MTVWGAWSSNDRLQAGIVLSLSPSTVGSGTSSVTVNWWGYGRTRYASFESGAGVTDWSISGDITGSGSMGGWNEGANGTWQIASGSKSFSTSFTSAIVVDVTFRFTSGGAYPGTTATVTTSITIPKRPYAVPAAPSGISAVRNSDAQATITWTRNATTTAPYSSQTLQMRAFSGSAWGAWSTIASPTGTATSYVKTGLSANKVYQFQVRANNTAGSSGYNVSGNVWMTPGAPSGVSSSINSSGTSITTSWTNTAYGSTPAPTFTVQRSVNGGAYSQVASGVTATSWTDPSPGAGTNTYRVASSITFGPLTSAFTTGNTVSTIVPPLAPTLLTPNNVTRDIFNDGITLTWKHNHGGDGAAQTAFVLQFSNNGGSTWTALTTGTITSGTSSYTVAPGVLANGVSYLWHVKTKAVATTGGPTSDGFGPYSASASIVASSQPTVTFVSGDPGAITTGLPLTTSWVYAQDQGSPQASWVAQLLDAGGTVLEQQSADDTTSSVVWAYPVQDQTPYTVNVQVQAGSGLWSDWFSTTTLISLPPPAPIDLVATFDDCAGAMVLDLAPRLPIDYPNFTNLITNPNNATGTTGWAASYGTGGAGSATQITDATAPSGSGKAFRMTWTTAPSAVSNIYLYAGVVSATPMVPAAPADIVSGRISVRPSWANLAMRANVYFYNSSNTLVGSTAGGIITLTAGAWTDLTVTNAIAPAGTTQAIIIATAQSGSLPGVGGTLDSNAALLVKSATLPAYFDGNTPTSATSTYAWSGTANASTSVATGRDEVTADFAKIERRVYGGDWVTLAPSIAVPNSFTDPLPLTNGDNEYRVTSISTAPSYLINPVVSARGTDGDEGSKHWIFVNWGGAFGNVLRFRGDPKTGSKAVRERTATRYLGRHKPVLQLGDARAYSVDASGALNYDAFCPSVNLDDCEYDSSVREWEVGGLEAGIVCYRDYTGRRFFGMLGEVAPEDVLWPGKGTVSFSCTETDFDEAYSQAPVEET